MKQLGQLKRIDPRSVWPNEAHDFTPWLAAHLTELGDSLGLDLEWVATESPVGRFSADLVAKDLGSGRTVVIENQLEPTDHTHLGQIITYAAGLDASVIIWVCRELREEHRQALDWLNRGHGTGTDFFGVVLELIQVDDSAPGVNFRPVAFPNNWSRRSVASARGNSELSSKQLLYQAFFQQLLDELRETHRFTKARVGQPQNWYSFSTGVKGFNYSASFANGGRLRTEIYIDLGDAEKNYAALQTLRREQDRVADRFEEPLVWETLDGRRACRVAVYRAGSIEDSAEEVEGHRAWAIQRLLTFENVFGPHLKKLL